jgi:hypothetical protein
MAPKPKARAGRRDADLLGAVGELLDDLSRLGYEPTLIGGMALVVLGSPRVTRDFDFLVIEEAREQNDLIRTFYRHRFELASRTDAHGNILRTIDSEKVASTRLRSDRPKSAYFYRQGLGLRVDLLFDFPIRAHEVRARSTRKKIRSHVFQIASREDLIRMKEIAARDRRVASDAQDLEFLKLLRVAGSGSVGRPKGSEEPPSLATRAAQRLLT